MLKNNIGLKELKSEDVILVKSEKDNLWLWSEEAQTGIILPWIQ